MAEKIVKIDLDKLPAVKKAEQTPIIESAPAINPEVAPKPSPKIENIKQPLEKTGESLVASIQPTAGFLPARAAAIDNILAEGLNDIFLKMPPAKQAEFKKVGEETVTKINVLLSQARVRINKIIRLIRKWLNLVPGINKFFLEQEAKIKADKILQIKNRF